MFVDDDYPHLDEPEALVEVLDRLGLQHLAATLANETPGSLFLQCEDRVAALAHLQRLGIPITERRNIVNGVASMKRER